LANLEISHKKEELSNSKKTTRHVDTASLEEATEQIITVNKNIEDGKVNEAACKITDIIRTVQIVTEKRDRKAQPWFDITCYRKRCDVLNLLHSAKKAKSPETLQQYGQARRQYKLLIKEKKQRT
ncbi:hypothetical protein ANN_21514, partial [Periplaneta americana]